MKNYFLILALCCAVAIVGCEKKTKVTPPDGGVNTPEDMAEIFPDPVFRAYVLENFDTNKDSIISKTEAEAVTEIDVSNYDNRNDESKCIKSLEGIQYFTNLTYLNCDYNQLTALDVSKNTQLTQLTCYYNQLTALDVSQNKLLTILSCTYNQLTTLDVSKNTLLEWLSCDNTQLASLDVSGCRLLTTLNCDDCKLTTLDVRGCTQLKDLFCRVNQLTTLDVSNNTQLTSLCCNNNELMALDVSNNTQLVWLVCYGNQLTTLDISKTNLGEYYIDPLYCAPMETLQTLYLKKGWSIKGITEERNTDYIPEQTKIVFVD